MQDIWNGVREGLGYVLAFFYSIIPNTGVAIILLTVSVRLILFPLTAKQAKSMLAMQRVQPEIKKLQAKYKNDRQKQSMEMLALYREVAVVDSDSDVRRAHWLVEVMRARTPPVSQVTGRPMWMSRQ